MSAPATTSGGTLVEAETDLVDLDHQLLIDRLVPPAPSQFRRFLSAAAVIAAATAVGLAWQIGLIVPQPTLRSETMQWAVAGVAPDGEHVLIDGLVFENSSLTTLELVDVAVDGPGLMVDSMTWIVSSPDGPTSPRKLPAVVAPGAAVRVELWVRPETCADPRTGEWGEVSGRWQYPDRPSWWGRWEPLDNPLWNADADPDMVSSNLTPSALSLGPVAIDGEELELDGPLSGACLLLGIDQ